METTPENVRYRHLRTEDSGNVTVCALMSDNDSQVPARLGFAFCSPRDQFSKKTGRIKSSGRARSAFHAIFAYDFTETEVNFFRTGFTAGILAIMNSLADPSRNLKVVTAPQWFTTKFWPAWKKENPEPEDKIFSIVRETGAVYNI